MRTDFSPEREARRAPIAEKVDGARLTNRLGQALVLSSFTFSRRQMGRCCVHHLKRFQYCLANHRHYLALDLRRCRFRRLMTRRSCRRRYCHPYSYRFSTLVEKQRITGQLSRYAFGDWA